MKVLVTGNAGFVGRQVASHLLERGWQVTGFDLSQPESVEYHHITGDLRDADAVTGASEGHEVICHIGAIGDVYLAGEEPALAAEVNVAGSANIARAARSAEAKVVYASTWEVYGEPQYQPIDESHPCSPDHPYNITKLAGEQILLTADRMSGIPVAALRLGTAYGPGLRSNSVFSIFIDKAMRGERIEVHGDGTQTRQFTHVSDIARAFELACVSDFRGGALNTVASESVSIKSLVDMVIERFPTDVVFGDPRPGDVPPATVSSGLIKQELGWEAETQFQEGLDELMSIHEAR